MRNIDLRYLRRIARSVIEDELRITPGLIRSRYEIGIHIVASREMIALNQRFLGHAGTTDVITLDYDEWEREPIGEAWTFGDIFICIDEAISQARRFHTDWTSELVRYLIHGLLHLRGRDDSNPAARRLMKGDEDRLLKEIARSFPLRKLTRNSRVAG